MYAFLHLLIGTHLNDKWIDCDWHIYCSYELGCGAFFFVVVVVVAVAAASVDVVWCIITIKRQNDTSAWSSAMRGWR